MNYHPTAIAVVIILAVMLTTSMVQWTFLIGLKRRHGTQWNHAGRPTIWSDQSFMSAWPTVKYLQLRSYTDSGDRRGIRFCERFRYPMVIGYWITIIVFVGGIPVAVLNGWPPSWN